jgi:predicted N-acetyltransferase YhbS
MTIQVTIEKLDYSDALAVTEFYEIVMRPNFSADELETQDSITEGMREGRTYALIARTAPGAIVGGVVGDWFADSQVMLFSYIAVPEKLRGSGIGRQLLAASHRTWTEEMAPLLIIGEVEDPRYYQDSGFGDPVKRVALYESTGSRSLPVPYFQPALRPGASRVPHLLLMVFGGSVHQPESGRVDGAVVERFLKEYFELSEGPPREDDPGYHALIAACRQPGGLPLLLVKDLPPVTPPECSP